MTKGIFDVEGLAEYTGFKVSYIYQLTHFNKLPHYKPGGKKIFFKKEEIDEWLTSKRVKTTEEIEAEASNYIHSKSISRRR